MTALDMLPPGVRRAVELQDGTLRADLAVIPAAEAAGWQVIFPENHWHNSPLFSRQGEMVWQAGRGWQQARLVDGHYSLHRRFPGFGPDALRLALGLEDAA